jgi:hypothetical protein
MERNFLNRRDSSPQTKRREKRLQKLQKTQHEQSSPTSSDQETYGKASDSKVAKYATKASATETHQALQKGL